MTHASFSSSLLALNTRLFILGMGLFLIIAGSALVFVHQYFLEQVQQRHFEKQYLLLAERIDKKEKILHAVTLVLANNALIQDAMGFEDREMLINQLGDLNTQFGYWTGFVNYAFHVITHDGRSLYRNYDPDNYGQDLTGHSVIIEAMSDLTKSVTALGKGGYGNVYRVINSQPVFAVEDPQQLVGFMSVSQGLRQIVMEYEQDALAYYVFERNTQEPDSQVFVVDGAPYFVKRQHSDWQFTEGQLNHAGLQLRGDWYFQTQPIATEDNRLQAFHLILTPKAYLHDQAWLQTQQVLWVLLFVFLVLLVGGAMQLDMLKRTVLNPMQSLTQSLRNIITTERYNQPVVIERQDEIGHVGLLFNQMLNKTDQLIFDLNTQTVSLDKALASSERANKAKSDFLASMSHELRTPLNAIIGYAQLLELASLQPKSLKQVQTILSSSKHLLSLINDILDFAKLETGKMQFDLRAHRVSELVMEAVTLVEHQAHQQGIQLEIKALAANLCIEVDRLRMKQILVNLLSNAIKYNKPAGKVEISCQRICQDETEYWRLTISDTGVGIAEDDFGKLFEPFNRLGHESSATQGTGIGLSITKDLVEQMSGWLTVESQLGEGSHFSVNFPIVSSVETEGTTNRALIEHAVPADVPRTIQVKLLYVGSHIPSIQALATVVVARPQIVFKVAPNLDNAVQQLSEFSPDLVLVTPPLDQQFNDGAFAVHVLIPDQLDGLSALIDTYLDTQKIPGSRL